MSSRSSYYLVFSFCLLMACAACKPSIPLPIQSSAKQETGFDKTLAIAVTDLEGKIASKTDIPVPRDAGGGYTHEQHKDNAKTIYNAGQLFKITSDTKYANFVRDLLLEYAEVYPDWGLHPAQKEQSPGRMFWQNLNESWWLVHIAQAYGLIIDTLSESDREVIETRLLRNMADFLSSGSPETFDKIHNHGTWATAAVGLTGYAIGDQSYVEQALLGLDKSGEAGFLKQLDLLFSPDGYYNEGPYYQRYALMPFVIFAQSVERNNPERNIFSHRDEVLKKAIYTTIQQSYGGLFFPINDAIKDKGIATTELLHGVSIAYELTGDTGLLSIAQAQNKFVLTSESKVLADDLAAGKATPFNYQSMRLRDGAEGNSGALDILRASSDPNASVVVMKNTSQGLGHGHFDKLGFIFYDNGEEIISDYGAARFLNIEAKYGGHYLPENNAFAKQTIAHNALVVDGVSHFKGDTSTGNKHHPNTGVFVVDDNLKLATASIDTAYDGVSLARTMALVSDPAFELPVVIDVMSATSNTQHDYDLPFHYQGQVVETNFDLNTNTTGRSPLGSENGYQYLWDVASAKPVNNFSQLTWLKNNRFYTLSSSLPASTNLVFTEVGANDDNFNLRREPAVIYRTAGSSDVSYVSVIEPHGEYNPIVEFTLNSHSKIASVKHYEQNDVSYVLIETKDNKKVGLGLSSSQDSSATHTIDVNGASVSWRGPYKLFPSQ